MSLEEFTIIESYILTESTPEDTPESEYDAHWYSPRPDSPRDQYSDLEPVEYDMDDEPKN